MALRTKAATCMTTDHESEETISLLTKEVLLRHSNHMLRAHTSG